MTFKKLIVFIPLLLLLNNFLFAQQWTSNGTTIYYNGGSIGIGTNTPRTKVDIWNGDLTVTGTDLNGTAYVTSRGGNAYFGNNAYSNGISISPAGNVGIGTSTPGNKLHVEGSLVSTLGTIGFVQLWNDNAIIWKNGNQSGGLRFGSANDLTAGGWSEKLRILDNGNVGIGTGAPAFPLTVYANAADIAQFRSGGNGNSRISVANATAQINVGIGSTLLHPYLWSSTGSLFIGGDGANPTIFVQGMTNGNVGIGTTNVNDPNYKLFVETGIHTRKVKVDPLAWADYVFDKEYRLLTIEEVEQYIRDNNHLPELPSAKEVADNGIDLGENQVVLLKKIEELTLYTIEQNKRADQQDKKLEQQNKTIEQLFKLSEQANKELKELKEKLSRF